MREVSSQGSEACGPTAGWQTCAYRSAPAPSLTRVPSPDCGVITFGTVNQLWDCDDRFCLMPSLVMKISPLK